MTRHWYQIHPARRVVPGDHDLVALVARRRNPPRTGREDVRWIEEAALLRATAEYESASDDPNAALIYASQLYGLGCGPNPITSSGHVVATDPTDTPDK